jgi:hypothetical protein
MSPPEFAVSKKRYMRKHPNDSQALNRSSFPKSSAPIKRAEGLVAHFRVRANDPHLTDLVAGEQPLGVPIKHNNILKDDFIYRPEFLSPFA